MSVDVRIARSNDRFPGTEQGARDLLSEFLKPGADLAVLTKELQPEPKDYRTVFKPELAKKLEEVYTPVWKAGKMVLAPNPGQTELLLYSATSEEISKWTGNAVQHLPGGYEKIGPHIAEKQIVYRFKFVKPTEKLGMAFDGFVFVNGHWRVFPKPYRALE